MGDLLIGLGAAGGLMALKKGWDKWGKGSKLAGKFAFTGAQKAAHADAAKEKRDKAIEIAKKTGDEKALNKLLTPDEKAQFNLDQEKQKQDKKTTRADAAALDFDKDEDDIIIDPADAEKYKKIAGKAPTGWITDPEEKKKDPKTNKVIKKEDEPKKKENDEEAFNPEGDMTITESNELQAIMALDDAGIKAEINRKGQVVIKKKDKKKAHIALEKSFKKGGWPSLKLEDVELDESEANDRRNAAINVGIGLRTYLKKHRGETELEKIRDILLKGKLPQVKDMPDDDKSKKVILKLMKNNMKNKFAKRYKGYSSAFDTWINEGVSEEIKRPRTPYEVVSEARNRIIETIDRVAADELYNFMQNERDLERQKDSIIKNIIRKKKSGKYDHSKAPKLWMYWVDSGAKAYDKEYSSPGVKTFDKDTRGSVAIQFANEYNAEIDLGNYS